MELPEKWAVARRQRLDSEKFGPVFYFVQGDCDSAGKWTESPDEATGFVAKEYADSCCNGLKIVHTATTRQNARNGEPTPTYAFSSEELSS